MKCEKETLYRDKRVSDVYIHHGDNKKLKKLIKVKNENFKKNLSTTVNYYLTYLKNGRH